MFFTNKFQITGIIVNDVKKYYKRRPDGSKKLYARINVSVPDQQLQKSMVIPIVFYNYKKDVVPSRFKKGDKVSVTGKVYTKYASDADGIMIMHVTLVASKIDMVKSSSVFEKTIEQKFKEIRLQYDPDVVDWRLNNG